MKSYKDILESLKGGQRKLDKNKNGKLDASDFKALRNEEEDEVSEDMYSSDYKYNAATGRKTKAKRIAMNFGDKEAEEKDEKKEVKEGMNKEEVELDEKITVVQGKPPRDSGKFTSNNQSGVRTTATGARIHAGNVYTGVNKPKKEEVVDEAETTVTRDKAGKIISFKHVGDWKKSTSADKKKNPVGKVANIAGKAMQSMKKMANEEKDEGEYDYEGDMAISQLKTIIRHSEHLMGMLEPDTNLPEWVQSKITLATDYMQTAHDYMMSEMSESKKLSQKEIQSALTSDKNKAKPKDQVSLKKAPWDMKEEEELDERNKENAIKRKNMDASRGARFKVQGGTSVPDPEPQHKTGVAHNKAIGRAIRQMSNEEIEHVDEVVRVRDRDRAKIDPEYGKKGPTLQHRADRGDLADAAKDRRAKTSAAGKHGVSGFNSTIKKKDQAHRDTSSARAYNVKEEIEEDEVKVSYRDFIKEYESKDGKYVHKGSYGTSYKDPEGDDEPSAKKPAAKKPGRPAGAKSGALQNRQPIKFK